MFITILQHIPTWVFGLFAGLVALGVAQSFPRQVSLKRVTLLPLALLALSLQGVMTGFGNQALALPAWGIGLLAALLTGLGRTDLRGVRFDAASRRFAMPGSWLPLALMMGVFAVKFGAGFSLATQPALHASTAFAVSACAVYGLFSGVFLGRAITLWSLARQTLRTPGQPTAAGVQ